jgi:4-carboxymuconolactone decarboxylase
MTVTTSKPGAGQSENSRYERGVEARSDVLGPDHVANSLGSASPFSFPMQRLATELCWGDIWTRPGLDRRTRSLLTLVMLAAMNRMHEFAVHVKGAIRNGCTVEELQEALLQMSTYCGVPAGMEAFRVADRELRELADDGESDHVRSSA